jgi:hypothetical protein
MTTDLKWPDDWLDCIDNGPERGEVGYIGDIEELREYPCPCCSCRSPFPAGTRVRMTRAFRKKMRWSGSRAHIREFGRCIGVSQGLTEHNNVLMRDPGYDFNKLGPEIDVRWEPSNLRYAYAFEDLEIVR